MRFAHYWVVDKEKMVVVNKFGCMYRKALEFVEKENNPNYIIMTKFLNI